MNKQDFLHTQESRRSTRAQQSGIGHKILRRASLRQILGDLRRLWGNLTSPSFVEIAGIALPIHPSFGSEVRTELYSGRYEQGEIHLLAQYLLPNDRLLELGGGLGLLSTFAAQKIGSINVLLVEANPEMVPLIREVHRKNKVDPGIKSGAVARTDGTLRFHIAQDFWGSSTEMVANGEKTVEVTAFALDKLIHEFRPTFLVCDIEGGEFDLFEDTQLVGVRAVIVEVHSKTLLDKDVLKLFDKFARLGFVPTTHTGEPHVWFLQRV